ncbi:MAG: hydrogenase iron-sulfur subunit [Desulfobacterales bacterium]|nr:hydrogenase iron-sulfur subunit [Desulfobacterales bacterium]
MEGNTNAKKRVNHLKKLISSVNLEPERVEMYNLSAAMGQRWAEICIEFSDKIKSIGPSPIWKALKNK